MTSLSSSSSGSPPSSLECRLAAPSLPSASSRRLRRRPRLLAARRPVERRHVAVAFLWSPFPPRLSAARHHRRQVRSAKPLVVRLFVKPEDCQSHPLVFDPFVSVAFLRSSLLCQGLRRSPSLFPCRVVPVLPSFRKFPKCRSSRLKTFSSSKSAKLFEEYVLGGVLAYTPVKCL
nr:uncharacterized protein LOC107280869 isoform X1 [Oryza sativa Japonica Group]